VSTRAIPVITVKEKRTVVIAIAKVLNRSGERFPKRIESFFDNFTFYDWSPLIVFESTRNDEERI
jgi:hypothetical protein